MVEDDDSRKEISFHNQHVHGNVSSEDEAKGMSSTIILEGLNPSPPPRSIIPELHVIELKEGKEYVHRMPEPNENNTNSCVELLLQVGALELKDVSVLALIHQLLKEPAFNELRTNEQVRYVSLYTRRGEWIYHKY